MRKRRREERAGKMTALSARLGSMFAVSGAMFTNTSSARP